MAVRGSKELIKPERPGFLSPLDEMERWFEEMWRRPFSLLRPSMRTELEEFETQVPFCDIYEEGKEIVVKADLPGMKRDELKIDFVDNVLTISGENRKEEKVEKGGYYRFERKHGTFFRRFEIPYEVDADHIKAHFEDGVLEIRLPKTHEIEGKAKKIEIS